MWRFPTPIMGDRMRKIWTLMAILFIVRATSGYKILLVTPFPGKSHTILGEGYVRHLLKAGHEVTYITPLPMKIINNDRLHQVDVSSNFQILPEDACNIKAIMNNEFEISADSEMIILMRELVKSTLMNENVKKLLNDPTQHFDLVISEWLLSEHYSGFAAVYECPFIWSSSFDLHTSILSIVDEAANPAYVAHYDSINQPPFSFIQRVKQLWVQIKRSVEWNDPSFDNELYKQAFGPAAAKRGVNLPEYEKLKYNASFVFGNPHPPLSPAIRVPRNYREIGGFHIETEVKPLPEKLQKIMDSATHGVIYFSMGSHLRSKDMPDELKRDLVKMFGQLQQTVLWKFEENLPNLPKNVHIMNWAPQPSILAHPNCMIFITHGGLLSTTETIHFGVPIIGVPGFVDQFANVARAVNKGFAKKVDLSYNLADDLKVAIQDMLNNPRYRERAKELSRIFRDRPLSPGAELVFWAEHVVRTGGAPHLRSPALMVPWYQKMYLDLLALILVTLIVVFTSIKCLCFSKKRVSKTKKNK